MAYQVVKFSVDFQRRWQTRYPDGIPFRVWAPYGMPAIPEQLLEAVFYLYETADDARRGSKAGGTGFFIGLKSAYEPLGRHIYAVSNQHVVNKHSLIRLNTKQGKPAVLPLDAIDWEPHQDGDDIAVAPIDFSEHEERFKDVDVNIVYVPEEQFAFKERNSEYEIGVGEDVFMIGRFGPHDGALKNQPSVRFGHISMMADPHNKVLQADRDFKQESFCVDMHSLFGYSGSPVFTYRVKIQLHIGKPEAKHNSGFMYLLLGVHWGSLWDQLKDKERGKEIHTHGGINGVVPVWKLWELLQTPKLIKQREEEIMKHKQRHGVSSGISVLESAPAQDEKKISKVRDEILRTMLGTPHQPRKKSGHRRVKSK